MDLRIETLALEQRVKKVGRVDDFCRQAGIDRATWQRWKNGDIEFPNMKRWLRVQEAIVEMEKA